MKRFLLGSVLAFSAAAAAMAGPVFQDTWYAFGFNGPGSFATDGTSTTPTTNPVAAIADAPPWTFTAVGPVVFTVLDLFLSVDQFDVFNNNVLIGSTSAPVAGGTAGDDIGLAFADPNYSRGNFVLGAGSHSITIQQTAGQDGAAVFRFTQVTEVPEPMTLALLGIGLLGLAAARRRGA
jgi:hypothetical protein